MLNTYASLPPLPSKISSIYTKVIVVKVDSIESTIVDEHNFGINDTEEICDFINSYDSNEFICIKKNIDSEDMLL